MANPRQRRKGKSCISKVSKKSDSRKKQSNKRVVVTGPSAFVKSWDKTKTARQNFDRLGLLSTLDPRQAGGLEKVEGIPFALRTSEQKRAITTQATDGEIPEGFARIERDEAGKIIRVVFSGGDEIDMTKQAAQAEESTPWGEPLNPDPAANEEMDEEEEEETIDTKNRIQGIPLTASRKSRPGSAPAARALEADAASRPSNANTRRITPAELSFLESLVRKHGDDIEAMARDLKLNVRQRTPGELKAAFKRAGGLDSVKNRL